MKTVNWYALEKEKLCDMCKRKKGKHTTLIGEVLCDECAKILHRYKYITTAEEFLQKSLLRFILNQKS